MSLRLLRPRVSIKRISGSRCLRVMVDDEALRCWFCREVLPLEAALMAFLRRNWREAADLQDLRQDIYERVLKGAREQLPQHSAAYVYTVARNHLINCARRSRIVSFELLADLDDVQQGGQAFHPERQLVARDELKRAIAGLDRLPPRCREIVRLRKVEGLSTRETAARLDIGVDAVEKQITLGMRALVDFVLGGTGKIQWSRGASVSRRRRP